MLFTIYTDGHFRGGWSNHSSHMGDERWSPLIEFFSSLDSSKVHNFEEYSNLPFDLLADDAALEKLLQIASETEAAFHPE